MNRTQRILCLGIICVGSLLVGWKLGCDYVQWRKTQTRAESLRSWNFYDTKTDTGVYKSEDRWWMVVGGETICSCESDDVIRTKIESEIGIDELYGKEEVDAKKEETRD
jgi:hypothetical protein